MTTYIVATRRGFHRTDVSAEQRARQVRGVKIVGASNPHRVVIEASQQAADEISSQFGDEVIVEREILHRPTG